MLLFYGFGGGDLLSVVVINGTDVRGCTYRLKEVFLKHIPGKPVISEFYLPSEGPDFCLGCKLCFYVSEDACPHAERVQPIWQAMMNADVIVISYPVYALRIPGQLKTLFDHFCCHWMLHRPKREMFTKTAVILTQSMGAFNRGAQKDVKVSLNWLGVSKIKRKSFSLIYGTKWEDIPEKKQKALELQAARFASSVNLSRPARIGVPSWLYFTASRGLQKILKKRGIDSVDNRYWQEQGWI